MPHRDRTLIKKFAYSFLLSLALSACGDDDTSSEVSLEQNYSGYTSTIFVSFESGPNAGRHQYVADGSQQSKIELKYNSQNDVTFMEFRGLISLDGKLRIDELRRFTKGELSQGNNTASTWRAESSAENKQCGALNLRDHDNTQRYQNAFGIFSQCSDTVIDSLSTWRNADDSVTMNRITKGQFSDRVQFKMSMDNAPFQNIETDVTVEFDLLEAMARF